MVYGPPSEMAELTFLQFCKGGIVFCNSSEKVTYKKVNLFTKVSLAKAPW